MGVTTFSSRKFNQETGSAKKAADSGPVFITDRGKHSYVLLSIEDYHRLTAEDETMGDALSMPDNVEYFDFEPPKLNSISLKPAELD